MHLVSHRQRAHAFTLVELIVVVTIIALVVTFSTPHVAGMLASARLRSAADTVQSRLQEAQSLAAQFNTDAELRLYEVPDLVDDRSRPLLRKIRLFLLQPPATDAATSTADVFEPAGLATYLDAGVEVSPQNTYSSLVELGFTGGQQGSAGERYLAVRFRPDGSASLPSGRPWFLTVHDKDAHLRGPRLKNFVTLQVDPATGRLRTFQP